jgi:hypothetical protein
VFGSTEEVIVLVEEDLSVELPVVTFVEVQVECFCCESSGGFCATTSTVAVLFSLELIALVRNMEEVEQPVESPSSVSSSGLSPLLVWTPVEQVDCAGTECSLAILLLVTAGEREEMWSSRVDPEQGSDSP